MHFEYLYLKDMVHQEHIFMTHIQENTKNTFDKDTKIVIRMSYILITIFMKPSDLNAPEYNLEQTGLKRMIRSPGVATVVLTTSLLIAQQFIIESK